MSSQLSDVGPNLPFNPGADRFWGLRAVTMWTLPPVSSNRPAHHQTAQRFHFSPESSNKWKRAISKPSTCACFLLFCLYICLRPASLLTQLFHKITNDLPKGEFGSTFSIFLSVDCKKCWSGWSTGVNTGWRMMTWELNCRANLFEWQINGVYALFVLFDH